MAQFIDFVTGLAALAYFLVIASATKQHFKPGKYPLGMYVISLLSLVGISTLMAYAFVGDLEYAALPLVMILIAFALFVWSVKHSKKTQLPLAFDKEVDVSGIITSGPWRYVRHPFYVSYVLFWLGCAIATLSLASIVVFAALLFIYIYSAVKEEAALKAGPHRHTYLSYKSHTGFCLPKLPSRS